MTVVHHEWFEGLAATPVDTAAFEGPPIPLGALRRPPFPIEALPEELAAYVRGLSWSTQTPPDLSGCLVLGAASGAIAGRVRVVVRNGWNEPVNIYICAALPSGERKSTVFRQAMRPLEAWEREQAILEAPVLLRLQAEAALSVERADRMRRNAADGKRGVTDSEAVRAAMDAEERKAALRPATRLLASDVTPEAFTSLLAAHGGRLVVASPEGGIFEGLGRYQKSGVPNIDAMLKAHAGDTIRVDRIGRAPEFVPRPAAVIVLAVQPDVVIGLTRHEGFRGRGLLARVLYSLPRSCVGERQTSPQPLDEAVQAAYARRLRELLEIEPRDDDRPHMLRLDHRAYLELISYMEQSEPRLSPTGNLGAIADWAGKLAGACARLAAILHMGEYGRDGLQRDIGAGTMGAALRLGDYFLGHAEDAFDLMGEEPAAEDARRVRAWIDRHVTHEFVERDVFQALKGSLKTMERLRAALRVLIDHRHIAGPVEQPREGGTPGRPPSPRWHVNRTGTGL